MSDTNSTLMPLNSASGTAHNDQRTLHSIPREGGMMMGLNENKLENSLQAASVSVADTLEKLEQKYEELENSLGVMLRDYNYISRENRNLRRMKLMKSPERFDKAAKEELERMNEKYEMLGNIYSTILDDYIALSNENHELKGTGV